MTNEKQWDILFNTLVTYGQELLHYDNANYSYYLDELILSWKTGEDSGGNCWGGISQYTPCNQKQPEFVILDELLLQIDPDIKLRDFKEITKTITMKETCNREYYGNGSYYNQLVIDKDDFITSLNNIGYKLSINDLQNLTQHFEQKAYAYIESNHHHNYSKNKKGW